MIEKTKNAIIGIMEDKTLNIEKKDIEQYLSEVKAAVENDRYRLDRNAKRQDNINLFLDYVIDEAKAKDTFWKGIGRKLLWKKKKKGTSVLHAGRKQSIFYRKGTL